jgi:hypothetical protein
LIGKAKMRNWLTAAIILILVIVAGYFVRANVQEKGEITPSAVSQERQIKKVKASVTINPGAESQVLSVQDLEIEEGSSALDATKQVADVETSGEGEMAFVTSIDGKEADQAKKEFWELVINGKSSQVGAGVYKVKSGDEIKWQISKF